MRRYSNHWKYILPCAALACSLSLWASSKTGVIFLGSFQALAASEQTTPYVTTSDVNLRTGPGTQYSVIATLKNGTMIHVAGRDGDWLKIVSKQGNPPGYILYRFARPLEGEQQPAATSPEATYVTTAEVNVRTGPGTQYNVVARIPKDTKVQVLGVEGDWLKVQSKHGNPPGYIPGKDAQRY